MGEDCPQFVADEEDEAIIPCKCPDVTFSQGHSVSNYFSIKTVNCEVPTAWYYTEQTMHGYIGTCWTGDLDIDDKFKPYMTIEDGSGALHIYKTYSNNSDVYICEVTAGITHMTYYTELVIHGW